MQHLLVVAKTFNTPFYIYIYKNVCMYVCTNWLMYAVGVIEDWDNYVPGQRRVIIS
jgi:hypothetical protein